MTGWTSSRFSQFLVKNICPSSAKSICYFSVCHWVVSQGSGCSGHSAYLSIQKEQWRWDMLSGLSSVSLGWLLNGKQKNSIYSWQKTGIFFHMGVNFLFFTPLWALYTPDLLSPMIVSRSWYQDLGTRILVPRSWYQDFGTRILVPRS